MQVKQPEKKTLTRPMIVDKEIEHYDKEELSYVYREIKEELTRHKPQSLAIFEQWVARIYKQKVKITDLEGKNIEFSISAADIQNVVNKILLQTCELHRHLIEEQLTIVREMGPASEFFKVDADAPGIGYLNNPQEQQALKEGTKIEQSHSQGAVRLSQHYYEYCVWVIYNHYCSLTSCNEDVCELAKLFHENSENLFYRIFKQIQRKKNSGESELENPSIGPVKNKYNDNSNQIRQIVSMVEDEQVVKLNELNVLTIVNLIPPSIPARKGEGKDCGALYWHICSFQTSINTIIYENKQNMRRYVVFLRNFKKAIKILKDRLSKPVKLNIQRQKEFPGSKAGRENSITFEHSSQQFISSQIEKKMDKERLLDQFGIQDQKIKSEEAQLVRNIDELIERQKIAFPKKPEEGNELKQKIRHQQIEPKKPEPWQMPRKNGSKQNIFGLKNSNFLQTSRSIESITRISAMLTENNIQSYKFQVVVKKNDKNGQKASSRDDERMERRKKLDQLSGFNVQKNLQKEIVEQLKNSLNSLIKNQPTKEQQFTNYLKMTQKHERSRKHFKFDSRPQSCELNLHEFIQQSNFKNDDEDSEADQNYLQRMEEEHIENQRKKKKKKNKKKKNQREDANPMAQDISKANDETTASQSLVRIKANLLHDICQKQYQIIKMLENTKIDKKNRIPCFDIQQQLLQTMRKRQIDNFDKSIFRNQVTSVSKTKTKPKKQKTK